jgi:hypothetical protein
MQMPRAELRAEIVSLTNMKTKLEEVSLELSSRACQGGEHYRVMDKTTDEEIFEACEDPDVAAYFKVHYDLEHLLAEMFDQFRVLIRN